MAQWVKDLAFVTAAALVTAVVQVQKKEKKNQNIIGRITQHHIFLER